MNAYETVDIRAVRFHKFYISLLVLFFFLLLTSKSTTHVKLKVQKISVIFFIKL